MKIPTFLYALPLSATCLCGCSTWDSSSSGNGRTAQVAPTTNIANPGDPNYQPGSQPVMQLDNPHQGEMRSIKTTSPAVGPIQ